MPASLLDLRGRRRRRARVSSIKWDEQGAGSFWGALGRSRHGGDPRPHAQERSDRDLIVPDLRRSILGASRSRGGRSTACIRHGLAAVVVVGRGERARAGAALISRCVAPGEGRGEWQPWQRFCYTKRRATRRFWLATSSVRQRFIRDTASPDLRKAPSADTKKQGIIALGRTLIHPPSTVWSSASISCGADF